MHRLFIAYECLLILWTNSSQVIGKNTDGQFSHCQRRCNIGHGGLVRPETHPDTQHAPLSIQVLSRPQTPEVLPWPHPHRASGRQIFYGRSRFWDFVHWEAGVRPSRLSFTWNAPITVDRLGEVAVLQVDLRGLQLTPVVRVMIWNTGAQALAAQYEQALGRRLNRIMVIAGLYQTPLAAITPRITATSPQLIHPEEVFTPRRQISRMLPNPQGNSAPWITWTFAVEEGDADPGVASRLPGNGDSPRSRTGHTYGRHMGHWPTESHSQDNTQARQSHSPWMTSDRYSQEALHRDYLLSRFHETVGSVLLFQWTITIDDEPITMGGSTNVRSRSSPGSYRG